VTAALELLQGGGRRIEAFGPADADEVFGVGLTCGGNVRVYLEEWQGAVEDATEAALRDGSAFALATVVEGPGVGAKLLVRPGHPEVVVFVESFVPAPRLLVFGAVDFTAALVRVAKVLGYHVTVCDARAVFATPRRFPLADEVVVDRPDRLLDGRGDALTGRDAVCVLTHDHKLDVPAILAALRTDVGYLGAMGSRRTHAERTALLREAGATDADLARVHGPIGLDLGARTPEETAVAICAEIIASRTGRSDVRPLRDTEGPIHARP
jgi:xanthine dehydrogenase accessory factor